MASSSFLQFDLDGDGAITSDEMKHAMLKLLGKHTSKNEIDAVVKEADNNGDGTVDFEGKLNKHRPQKNDFILQQLFILFCVASHNNITITITVKLET